MRMFNPAAMLLLASPFLGSAAAAGAQTTGTTDEGWPPWTMEWSPLSVPAVWAQDGIGAPASLDPLGLRRRIGTLWTGGNPAGLPFEVGGGSTRFRGAFGDAGGEYRRPLDPAGVAGAHLAAMGWRPLGRATAGIASARFTRETYRGGSPSDFATPYTMNPFLAVDTTRPAMEVTEARLQGALGRRFGPASLGLAVAIANRNGHSRDSPVARRTRAATPAAALGAVLPVGGLHLGLAGRWSRRRETGLVATVAARDRIIGIHGYAEPTVAELPLRHGRYYRMQRDFAEPTGQVMGELAGVGWIFHGGPMWLTDVRWSEESNDPPRDRWASTGYRTGAAVDRGFCGGRCWFGAELDWNRLSGDGVPADTAAESFHATASQLAASASVDLAAADSAWWGRVLFAGALDDRHGEDRGEGLITEMATRSLYLGVAIARRLGQAWDLGASLGRHQHRARGSIPRPDALGPGYRDWIAPELGYYASPASGNAGSVYVRWRARATAAVMLSARYGVTGRDPAVHELPLAPSGDRRGWGAEIVVRLLPPSP